MKSCSVTGCDKKSRTKGYCGKHYARWHRHGDPLHVLRSQELHGMRDNPAYQGWSGMKARCYNPNNAAYKDYGGRGIIVCDRWKNSFSLFCKDMGSKPFPKAQLDRIDNDGNYEPGNCRWVSTTTNNQNRRDNVVNWFTVRSLRRLHKLKKFTRKELSLIYNLKEGTISSIIVRILNL